MGFVMFWVLCGIGAAIAASNKGRSGFAWFLLGLLIGPFAILFALIVQPTHGGDGRTLAVHFPDAPVNPPALPTDKKCPFCAETIKAEAIVCRYCGRDLPLQMP